MTVAATSKISGEPLADKLERRETFPASQALDVLRQLAQSVAEQHESGRLHLHIAPDTVLFDGASGQAVLREPLDKGRSFGGADGDDESCPPELQQAQVVYVPVDLTAAREALRAAGLSAVDPRRVDLYQLGVLLCRMLTGESVHDFLSRPRVAAMVPPEARDLIERALGHDPQRAFRSALELLNALAAISGLDVQGLPTASLADTRDAAKPDTTPSFVGVGKADTDAGRPAPLPTDDAALPFQKLGHYEIVGRLGRGGMGDVYKGYERRLDRYVAIKVLPVEFSRHEEMVRRFNAEASAAAKLVHPNTVEIFFIGDDQAPAAAGQSPTTLHFFAMQFVEGESLADLLARRQRLNVAETLAITEQVLAGLGAAHQLGMVHRDIKPGNILIDRQRQRVQLADFGLVKSLRGSGLTASGVIVGTADYMAPEQGRGVAVDVRADLYAIGVVLYQMLSGRLPFQADSATALIFQHVYEAARPLHEIAPDVPRPLCEIVAKLMAKSPDARHQSVEALLADLRAFHQGQPLPSAAANAGGTLDRPRTLIIPAPRFADEAVLPATLTRIAALDPWQRRRQAIREFFLVPSAEVVQQIQTTENQVDGAITEFERRQTSLDAAIREAETVAQELQTQQEIWQRAITEAEQRADNAPDDDTARAALGEKLRSERLLPELAEQFASQQTQLDEMRRKRSQVTATLERLRSQRDVLNARLKVARAQIHLAGGAVQAARAVQWMSLVRWRNVAQLALLLAVVIGAATLLTVVASQTFWDSTGQPLAGSQAIEVEDVEKLSQASTFEELYRNSPNIFPLPFAGCDKHVLDFAVSATHVAAVTGDRQIFVWDAESGKLLHQLTDNLGPVNSVAFSADGSLLATGESNGSRDSTLKFWNPSTGASAGVMPGLKWSVDRLAFHPKAPFLAGSHQQKFTVWNYETRSVYWTPLPGERFWGFPAFSADGSLLAVMDNEGEMFVWDVVERKQVKSWFTGQTTTPRLQRPLFLPDGLRLLTASIDGTAIIWDARTGAQLSRVRGLLPNADAISLSSDGRSLAVSNGQWTTLLDLELGFARGVWPGHQTSALVFSPNGDRLFSAGGQPFVTRWNTDVPTLTGRGPMHEIAAGPLYALAPNKSLCLLSKGAGIGLWNDVTRSPLMPLKIGAALDAKQSVAAFSADSRRAAVLDGQGQCSVWDVVSGEQLASVRIRQPPSENSTHQLEFGTDSDVIWATNSAGVWQWNLKNTAPELWLEWPSKSKFTALSPVGRFAVLVTENDQFLAWDLATRQQLFRGEEYPGALETVAFSGDGQRLVAYGHGRFYHWDFDRRKLLGSFQLGAGDIGNVFSLAFLPDKRHFVAFRSRPAELRVVDVERFQTVLLLRSIPLEGQRMVAMTGSNAVPKIRITHDGRFAVTNSSESNRLAFWDLHLHLALGKKQP